MIVTCANCQTKYNLPDGKIPEGGAKVKCSKCSHVFKVEPPTVATLEDEVENLLEEESQAPDTSAGDEFDETFDEVAAAEGAAAEEPEEEPAGEPVEESFEEPVEEPVEEPEDDLFAEAPEDETPAEEGLGDVSDMDDNLGDLFDDVGADEEEPVAGEPEEEFGGGVDEPADEEMPGVDDLFDDTDEADEEMVDDADGVAADVESLFGDDDAGSDDDIFADEDEESAADDDIFESGEEEESDVSDIFDESDKPEEEDELFGDEEAGAAADELFAATADDVDDEDEDEEEEFVATGKTDFGLDEKPVKEKSGKGVYVLIILLVLILGLGAAVYFKAWKLVGLDTESLKNLPVIGKMFMEETGGEEPASPGESPAERVRKIELRNVKQYYVANEKTGNLFVVEGKAFNRFEEPKERIKVEVILYDAGGNVLTSQSFLCGNQLSQFQLQVQTRTEVEEGLASEVGILSNNTFIRPGGSVPFMAVFFEPPAGVAEFLVKVVDVADPK